MSSSAVKTPKSSYARAVDVVVVAGAEMDVPAQAAALAPHDERRLRVDLQRREAVHDVHARLLQRARPLDVPTLVAARLDLDETHALLSVLRCLDQRRHERRVVSRSIDRRLEPDHLRVRGARVEERLEARGERVVRVMHEHVAGADRRELLVRVEPRERRPRERSPRIDLEIRAVELRELHRVGEVERAGDRIDEILAHAQPELETLAQRARHGARHLEPRDLAEAALAQLELDLFEQVVRLVRHVEVGVARDAERRALDDVHAGEERGQEVRREPARGARAGRRRRRR